MKTFIDCFMEEDVFLFTSIDMSSCIASLEATGNPGNICLLVMVLDLLLCGFRLFLFSWTRDHTDLEQMLNKIFVKIETESWKLP